MGIQDPRACQLEIYQALPFAAHRCSLNVWTIASERCQSSWLALICCLPHESQFKLFLWHNRNKHACLLSVLRLDLAVAGFDSSSFSGREMMQVRICFRLARSCACTEGALLRSSLCICPGGPQVWGQTLDLFNE